MVFYGLEKLSLVDFDGYVSATVFTGGCNFKCEFCHNSALVFDCTNLATLTEDDILAYLIKRKNLIEGLCITGGEPTLIRDLPFFIEKAKALGVKIKLDTNGTNPKMIKSLANNGLVDYFAMDIKSDKLGYGEIIGIPNYDLSKIEESVDFFLSGDTAYEFRTTLVKEYHDKNNIINISNWIKGADKYFLQKFKDSGNCIKSHLSAVEDNIALDYLEILKKSIPNTRLRGYDI